MEPRLLINLALAVLVLALAALALRQPGERGASESERLVDASAEQIVHIRVARADAPAIELARSQEGWRLTAPWAVEARPEQVELILRLLETESRARYPLVEQDRAEYGLDAPALSIALDNTSVVFGDTAPLDGRRYVAVGEALHLVDDTLFYLLQAPPESYVSTRLLPAGTRLESVRLPQLRLVRNNGAWGTAPLQAPAATAAEWAARWQRARAVRVRPYRNETEATRVAVHVNGGDTSLSLVALEGEDALLRPDLGLVYELPEGALAPLLHPAPAVEAGDA